MLCYVMLCYKSIFHSSCSVMSDPVITLCDFDYSIYFTTLCVLVLFFVVVFSSSLLCRVSMYVCVLVDFIFCSYLMGSCQCFVAFLSSSL